MQEAHMLSKGFTKAATDAARMGLGSFHDDFSASIHKLDRDLIKHFFRLLKPTGNPGWEQALAVVDAHIASLSPPGECFSQTVVNCAHNQYVKCAFAYLMALATIDSPMCMHMTSSRNFIGTS